MFDDARDGRATEITYADGTWDRIEDLVGRAVIDADGVILGRLEHVYRSRATHRPSWGVVGSVHGSRFVPLRDLDARGPGVQVAVGADRVRSAPCVDVTPILSARDEQQLAEHYGVA